MKKERKEKPSGHIEVDPMSIQRWRMTLKQRWFMIEFARWSNVVFTTSIQRKFFYNKATVVFRHLNNVGLLAIKQRWFMVEFAGWSNLTFKTSIQRWNNVGLSTLEQFWHMQWMQRWFIVNLRRIQGWYVMLILRRIYRSQDKQILPYHSEHHSP